MTAIHVEVTAEQIERGHKPADWGGSFDPVAHAIAEVLGPSVSADVDGGRGGWHATIGDENGDGAVLVVELPDAVGDWVRRFDAGHAVSPIAFDIELPDWLARACG